MRHSYEKRRSSTAKHRNTITIFSFRLCLKRLLRQSLSSKPFYDFKNGMEGLLIMATLRSPQEMGRSFPKRRWFGVSMGHCGRGIIEIKHSACLFTVCLPFSIQHPANTMCWPNVGLMLAQRRRRWASVSSTLGQRLVFEGMVQIYRGV